MKKTAISVALLFLLFTAKAQQAQFGFKGGMNISDLHFSGNNQINSKVGLHLGILAHIQASKIWAIQPEFLYSQEGAEQTITGNNNKVKYRLNYFNVPVLLQYNFDNGFRIEGGPQIGFLLNARTKNGNLTINNPNFKSTAFSIPLGISFLSESGVGFDARYVFGLSNIDDTQNGIIIQSNVFQLGIFIMAGDTFKHSNH